MKKTLAFIVNINQTKFKLTAQMSIERDIIRKVKSKGTDHNLKCLMTFCQIHVNFDFIKRKQLRCGMANFEACAYHFIIRTRMKHFSKLVSFYNEYMECMAIVQSLHHLLGTLIL